MPVSDLRREYLDSVWRFVRARCGGDDGVAEDLVAEIFSAAWRSMAEGHRPRSTWPWLLGIARRRLADFWRARGRKPTELSWGTLPAEERACIEEYLAGRAEEPGLSGETRALLRQALSDLRPEVQELLIAHHVEGVSLRELGRRSRKSESSIESAMARARAALRSAFLRRRGLLK
jgi:RNA polymerase sigma-70 factor (ECF subfamily)